MTTQKGAASVGFKKHGWLKVKNVQDAIEYLMAYMDHDGGPVPSHTVKGRVAPGVGYPSNLSAADLVTIVKDADGAGSGLDADLLDGQDGAFYAGGSFSRAFMVMGA